MLYLPSICSYRKLHGCPGGLDMQLAKGSAPWVCALCTARAAAALAARVARATCVEVQAVLFAQTAVAAASASEPLRISCAFGGC